MLYFTGAITYNIMLFFFTGVEILRSFTRKMVLFRNQGNIFATVFIAEHRHRNIYGQSK